VLREFIKLSTTKYDKALCNLLIGAFFFAMRSCEYLKVGGPRKTKLLAIKKFRFYRGKTLINHRDRFLYLADSVSITFEQQKRDTKNDIITQHKSGDPHLCPVKVWASIIKRLISHPLSTSETHINTFYTEDNKVHVFTGNELLKRIRAATTSIGPDILGFTAKQIGLHSARSCAAMAMYLAGVLVFTIMMLG
jgi:hypothetical protein